MYTTLPVAGIALRIACWSMLSSYGASPAIVIPAEAGIQGCLGAKYMAIRESSFPPFTLSLSKPVLSLTKGAASPPTAA